MGPERRGPNTEQESWKHSLEKSHLSQDPREELEIESSLSSLSPVQIASSTISLKSLVKNRGKDRGLWKLARDFPLIRIMEDMPMTRGDVQNIYQQVQQRHQPVRMDASQR